MRRTSLSSLMILALLAAAPSHAEESGYGIAAMVNEEIISTLDVEKRMKLVLATTGIPNTEENRERLRRQVVRSLLDERLQLQEAAKNNIVVTADDVTQGIAAIEQQRGMPAGSLEAMLISKGVAGESFQSQLKAQIAWNKLVARKLRNVVKVSEEEIEQARGRFATDPANQEVQIVVLTLPVDKPEHEPEVKRTVEKLAGEIRKGASFEQVARQFTAAQTEGAVAQAVWVNPTQLDPAIARSLALTREGQITNPVRTGAGYTIAKLTGRRALAPEQRDDMEVTFKDILLHVKGDASTKEADALTQISELVAKHPGNCKDPGIADVGDLSAFNIEVKFRTEKMQDLPASMQAIAKVLKDGEVSPPVVSEEGVRLFMMCEKKPIPATQAEKERIYGMLMQQKMELEAQKYMRNLRREAFVDIR